MLKKKGEKIKKKEKKEKFKNNTLPVTSFRLSLSGCSLITDGEVVPVEYLKYVVLGRDDNQ